MPPFSEIFLRFSFYFFLNLFCIFSDFSPGILEYFAFFSLIWTDMEFSTILGFFSEHSASVGTFRILPKFSFFGHEITQLGRMTLDQF